MIYIVKDYREKLHKIEYSSREALLKDIQNATKQLQKLYRDKALLDEELKPLVRQLEKLHYAKTDTVGSLIDRANSITEKKAAIYDNINNTHFLLGDNLEDKLNVKHFLGIGYRIHLPEIYEENLEEYKALLYSMIPIQ